MADGNIGIRNLEQALARYIEIGVESGAATGGTNVTLEDTTKSWEVNRWPPGDIHIVKDGTEYVREITANTATVITFNALPGGVTVAAGDYYSVRRITIPQDIVDRWARQLGQVDIARVLGAALAHANPLIARISDGAAFIAPATEPTLAKLIPIAKAAVFNTALPAAEAAWLGADITPTNSPSFLRVYVTVAVAGILRVARTVGGVTVTENLNGGANLAADCAYMFTVEWEAGDGLNFRYSVTAANILVCRAVEIGGAE